MNRTMNSLRTAACIVALLPLSTTALHAQAKPAAKPASTAATQPWKRIPIPPLPEFKPVQPKRIQLENGLVIFLQEDHELPLIDGNILIRGGSRDVPAAKIGLVSLYGESWRTSGSTSMPGDKLDEVLAAKAASIETSGGTATTSLSFNSLKQDFPTVYAQAIDLLEHPAFNEQKLTLAKRQMEAGIARRNDDASEIAQREAAKLAYGPTNPYARQAELSTVSAVTLDDLKAWHKTTVVPGNMIVSISGDFDPAAAETMLRATLGKLPAGPAFPKTQIDFPPTHAGVFFVNKTDVDQSNIYVIGLGTTRDNPDYYALSVMNEIFSGGFGSRLVQNVRTKLGLAYSVGGGFGSQYDHPGLFSVAASTKSVSTVPATDAIMAEMRRLKTDPPTPKEMRDAKDELLNSFIFHYDSRDKTLNEQVVLAFYGYPPDFLEKYRDGIEKVTAADVERVANKYIDPAKLTIVVVGNQPEITPPMSKLGSVQTLDITIPQPAGKPQEQ